MGQKGSRHMVQGGVDEEGFLADVVPGLPAWARRRGSLTTPEERLLEEEELDLLAAEVQRLVDGPLKTTSPHPQQTTRRGLLHSLRSLKRQPATFNLNTFDVSGSTTTTTTSRTGSVEEVVVDEDEAEFLYDMGKRMLLGREGGMELQRNPRCAVHLLQRAAAMGHVGAKWDLHCCRGRGDDITLDYTRAAILYARFAKMGHPVALSNLGVCYHKGRGVKKSLSKAVRYYTQAAQHNYARGNYNLAVCYDLGDGVVRDAAKAVDHYSKSARLGYAVAQYYMGVCYSHAKGMESRDFKQAIDMWRKAARQGHGLAQLVLANYHREGLEGLLPKDVLKAALLFRAAIGWGDEKAWDRLKDLLAASPTGDFEECGNDHRQASTDATDASDEARPVEHTTHVPTLYDQCCLHFFNRWTHHKVVAAAKTEQAQLPAEVVDKINREVRKCHNPACTKLRYGPGTVQRRWRLKAPSSSSEEEPKATIQHRPEAIDNQRDGAEERILELEGEGENGDEVTLHFCSHKCALAL